jgi:hypothetical protein
MQSTADRFIACLLLTVAVLTSSCRQDAAPIPNIIADDEYSVYAAWLKRHFKEQPARLLLANRTFIFDPIDRRGCAAGVPDPLARALHGLGEAEYFVRTEKFKHPPFTIPWSYEESPGLAAESTPPFRLIAFSRVAFNRSRSEGYFAVSDACGGLCGYGGAVLAVRRQGEWTFKAAPSCAWVY